MPISDVLQGNQRLVPWQCGSRGLARRRKRQCRCCGEGNEELSCRGCVHDFLRCAAKVTDSRNYEIP